MRLVPFLVFTIVVVQLIPSCCSASPLAPLLGTSFSRQFHSSITPLPPPIRTQVWSAPEVHHLNLAIEQQDPAIRCTNVHPAVRDLSGCVDYSSFNPFDSDIHTMGGCLLLSCNLNYTTHLPDGTVVQVPDIVASITQVSGAMLQSFVVSGEQYQSFEQSMQAELSEDTNFFVFGSDNSAAGGETWGYKFDGNAFFSLSAAFIPAYEAKLYIQSPWTPHPQFDLNCQVQVDHYLSACPEYNTTCKPVWEAHQQTCGMEYMNHICSGGALILSQTVDSVLIDKYGSGWVQNEADLSIGFFLSLHGAGSASASGACSDYLGSSRNFSWLWGGDSVPVDPPTFNTWSREVTLAPHIMPCALMGANDGQPDFTSLANLMPTQQMADTHTLFRTNTYSRDRVSGILIPSVQLLQTQVQSMQTMATNSFAACASTPNPSCCGIGGCGTICCTSNTLDAFQVVVQQAEAALDSTSDDLGQLLTTLRSIAQMPLIDPNSFAAAEADFALIALRFQGPAVASAPCSWHYSQGVPPQPQWMFCQSPSHDIEISSLTLPKYFMQQSKGEYPVATD
jgi:hypothetical protein